MSEPESKDADHAREAGEPSFRVVDRRRFAPDGSEREEAEPATSAPSAGAPAGSEARVSAPAAGERVAPTPSDRSSAAAPESSERAGEGFVLGADASAEQHHHDVPEPTLSTLLLSLSTQALMHLGEIPDLATGKPERDLPAARSIIDLLGVLERKTQGNLDAAETALLERILYDLRMRFVELSRS